jgi:hypothetical protein
MERRKEWEIKGKRGGGEMERGGERDGDMVGGRGAIPISFLSASTSTRQRDCDTYS